MSKIGGVNTASMGGCLHSLKTRARWVEEFHNEKDGVGQVILYLRVTMRETSNHNSPGRLLPGLTKTALSALHQDRGVKQATVAPVKIPGRDNITIGTGNTRTLRAAGKTKN